MIAIKTIKLQYNNNNLSNDAKHVIDCFVFVFFLSTFLKSFQDFREKPPRHDGSSQKLIPTNPWVDCSRLNSHLATV